MADGCCKLHNLRETFMIFICGLGALGVVSFFVMLCYLKNSKRAAGLGSKAALRRICFTLSLTFCFVLIEISHTDENSSSKIGYSCRTVK